MPINYLKNIQLGEFGTSSYRISPSNQVLALIEGFYVFTKDSDDSSQLVFNDGFPVLVFLQNAAHTITVKEKEGTSIIKGVWASAGSIRNVYINYNQCTDELFIVRFQPGAFYRLFGLTMQHFKNHPVSAFDQISKNNQFELSTFFKCKSSDEKVSFVETYVKDAFDKNNTPKIISDTLEHIHQTKGQSSVRVVTNNIGVSYKRLERSFTQHVGVLPKDYIQLQRFMNAYLELVQSEETDLTRIAVANGYYDANHFLKAFKSFTGKTPMAYKKFQSTN